MKYMRNRYDILIYFAIGLRCIYILIYIDLQIYVFFKCRRKNKTLFCANHAK